jgi:hypothetical protein
VAGIKAESSCGPRNGHGQTSLGKKGVSWASNIEYIGHALAGKGDEIKGKRALVMDATIN